MIRITITDEDGMTTTSTFDKSEVIIGRVKGNDVVFTKTNVSKRHARIVVKDSQRLFATGVSGILGVCRRVQKTSMTPSFSTTDIVGIGLPFAEKYVRIARLSLQTIYSNWR